MSHHQLNCTQFFTDLQDCIVPYRKKQFKSINKNLPYPSTFDFTTCEQFQSFKINFKHNITKTIEFDISDLTSRTSSYKLVHYYNSSRYDDALYIKLSSQPVTFSGNSEVI